MISAARLLAFDILRRVDLGGVFSDEALNAPAMNRLDLRDRNLVTELVYGTLRWQLLLDHILMSHVSRQWQLVEPSARILLRMSLYQLWHMDRIPDHALVHDAVEMAKLTHANSGLAGFVNGVLRNLSRNRPWKRDGFTGEYPPWVLASLPQWLWERWNRRFGSQMATDYANSLNKPPRTAFRATLESVHGGNQFEGTIFSDIVPGACFSEGQKVDEPLYAQDEASQLIPHLLGPVTGWRIWDACAAPGGKCRLLRELCGSSGIVVATDNRWRRIKRLAWALQGSGSAISHIVAADATEAAPFNMHFDAVFADVPCSGLGTLRRNPEIKWRFHEDRFPDLQKTQSAILASVSRQVRIGGFLVYSTCSTEPEENENIVNGFLESSPCFRLVPITQPPGVHTWLDAHGMLRTFPATRLWDGFFAAIMARIS